MSSNSRQSGFILLIVFGALVLPATARAAMVTSLLGEQDFANGTMLAIAAYQGANQAASEPLGPFNGADTTAGPSFNRSWTFSYGAVANITDASITIGIYDHDSAATGNQVAQFSVDGHSLTAGLNSLLNTSGGSSFFQASPLVLTSEYNVYSLTLPNSVFADLADGTATFTLQLTSGFAFPLGVPTNTANNGAGLDFTRLEITSQDVAAVPEPSGVIAFCLLLAPCIARRRQARSKSCAKLAARPVQQFEVLLKR